jgi:hypothetical protein
MICAGKSGIHESVGSSEVERLLICVVTRQQVTAVSFSQPRQLHHSIATQSDRFIQQQSETSNSVQINNSAVDLYITGSGEQKLGPLKCDLASGLHDQLACANGNLKRGTHYDFLCHSHFFSTD